MGKFLFLVKWLNSAKLTTTLRMEEGMSMTPEVSQYWQHFIEQQQLPPDLQPAEIYSFGNTEQMANELARLVIIGQKTATTSAIELYEPDEHVPQVGDYNVILDGRDRPVAITKTIMCTIVKYNQVDAEHAFLEGRVIEPLLIGVQFTSLFLKLNMQRQGRCLRRQLPVYVSVLKW